MIPKVIHYCWFGGDRKPKLIRECIKSWRIHLPDYEIKEWNENNTDLTSSFVRQAYKLKKWAFVADFIRLKILHENGGIYLDTDMIVVKSFNALLHNKCFFGAEDRDFISCGIIGSQKENEFIKECLTKYETIKINENANWGLITIPRIITDVFRKKFNFFLSFEKKIDIENLVIFPFIYFYPLPAEQKDDAKNYKSYLSTNTFTVHLWNQSWVDYSEFYHFRKGNYWKGFKKVFFKIYRDKELKRKYIRKNLSAIKESLFS